MSEIFRYDIEKLTDSTGFQSEHQMESFLFNNPKIIGVLRNEEGEEVNSAIIRQVSTLKPDARKELLI